MRPPAVIFRLLFLTLVASLSSCNMQAANHEPLIGHAGGDYKTLAACVFDQRHRDRTDVFISVNEARHEARIWQSVAISNSTPVEITFIQEGAGKVRIEVRVTYIGGPQSEFGSVMAEIKNCQS